MATPSELTQFLRQNQKRAFRTAYYLLGDEQLALDAVQDAMLSLSQSYADKDPAELTLVWGKIVQNKATDIYRKHRLKNSLTVAFSWLNPHDEEGNDEEAVSFHAENLVQDNAERGLAGKQLAAIIHHELQKMPLRQRQAFVLRYLEEHDEKDTAQMMECSAGSVKTHCHRACKRLAETLRAQNINPESFNSLL